MIPIPSTIKVILIFSYLISNRRLTPVNVALLYYLIWQCAIKEHQQFNSNRQQSIKWSRRVLVSLRWEGQIGLHSLFMFYTAKIISPQKKSSLLTLLSKISANSFRHKDRQRPHQPWVVSRRTLENRTLRSLPVSLSFSDSLIPLLDSNYHVFTIP